MSAEPPGLKPTLPLVVAVDEGRGAAWVRFVLAAMLLGLLIAVPTLVAAEWFSGPPAPWKARACLYVALPGSAAAALVALLWACRLPRRWVLTAEDITQVGPTGRRRVLRWGEVRRVGWIAAGLFLYGPRGSGTIFVRLARLPSPQRIAARAAIEERLGPAFVFPKALVLTRSQQAWLGGGTLLAWMPAMALLGFISRDLKRASQRGSTRLPWLRWALQQGWVRRWGQREPTIMAVLLGLWVFAPPLLWMLLIGWLTLRQVARRGPILPRDQPGGATPDAKGQSAPGP